MKLHLGVLDTPHDPHVTTGELALILEEKYDVMGTFVNLHIDEIADAMADSVMGSLLTSAATGATVEPFATAMGKIETMFNHYLDTEEIATAGIAGVPTQAALDGKSKRFKRQRGPRRPSFIDSGIYENSFKAWVDA